MKLIKKEIPKSSYGSFVDITKAYKFSIIHHNPTKKFRLRAYFLKIIKVAETNFAYEDLIERDTKAEVLKYFNRYIGRYIIK